nr:MAG TPA: hypothetical protein [Caudoviricetes sp.]
MARMSTRTAFGFSIFLLPIMASLALAVTSASY